MSAVAKLLLTRGVRVSGSDLAENEQTTLLKKMGVDVKIGHAPENIPADVDLVMYSSAAPESNPIRGGRGQTEDPRRSEPSPTPAILPKRNPSAGQ